jgi:hypothetical protein
VLEPEFTALRKRAADLIKKGGLPAKAALVKSVVASKVIANPIKCDLCAQLIKSEDLQYRITFEGKVMSAESRVVHFLCHAAWQLEAAQAEQKKGTAPS